MKKQILKDIMSIVVLVYVFWTTLILVCRGQFSTMSKGLISIGLILYLHFVMLPTIRRAFE